MSGTHINDSLFPGRKKQQSVRSRDSPVPLRKVKSPQRKRRRSRPVEKRQRSPEPPVEPPRRPDQRSDKRPKAQRKQPAAERTPHVDTVPRQTPYMTRHKQAVTASPESPTTNPPTSLDRQIPKSSTRKRRGESQPQRVCTSEEEEEEFKPARKKKTTSSKSTKKCERPEPLAKLRQPARNKRSAANPQMPDEDEWTEAELAQLQR